MYKCCFFVPETHVEEVKAAVFAAGAGHIGNYERCSWQCLGEGQFRPLEGADPFIGKNGGELEKVAEYRVEMVCEDAHIAAVVAALKQVHPYEEPACDVWALAEF